MTVFSGPHAYVSPRWYASRTGGADLELRRPSTPTARCARSPTPRGCAIFCTACHSGTRPRSETPWRMQDQPAAYLAGMLKGIVGIEIAVTRLEGKFKLSQNRPAADRPRIVAALEARERRRSRRRRPADAGTRARLTRAPSRFARRGFSGIGAGNRFYGVASGQRAPPRRRRAAKPARAKAASSRAAIGGEPRRKGPSRRRRAKAQAAARSGSPPSSRSADNRVRSDRARRPPWPRARRGLCAATGRAAAECAPGRRHRRRRRAGRPGGSARPARRSSGIASPRPRGRPRERRRTRRSSTRRRFSAELAKRPR